MLVVVLKAWVTEMNETRPCQPVDLIDHDHVDPSSANVIQQLRQGWPVHRAARKAPVVIAIPDQFPAFVGLASNIGFRRFSLVVERVGRLRTPR